MHGERADHTRAATPTAAGRRRRQSAAAVAAQPSPSKRRLTRADVEALLAKAASSAALDLRGADLREADLSDLVLAGARLEGARLRRARLIATDLQGAHLEGAQMEASDLRGAILSGAHADEADLSGAHLEGALLQGASLAQAHLAHAFLDGAHLGGAHLNEAVLWGASLRGAELDGGHFTGADMHEAILDGAFFAGCMLVDADLALVRWASLRAGEELAAAQAPLLERPEAYRLAGDAYRRLRQACAAQGLYDRAGELYRREMRMRQRALGYEAWIALLRVPVLGALVRVASVVALVVAMGALRLVHTLARPLRPARAPTRVAVSFAGGALARVWRPGVRWLWHVALEALCGYGERVGRVLVAAAIVMLGMALIYLRLGQLTEQDGTTVTSFWHALYFSACSFSSIGYAAFAPNAHGLAKWLGIAESFTGNFLLALFLVTFTRKLTR